MPTPIAELDLPKSPTVKPKVGKPAPQDVATATAAPKQDTGEVNEIPSCKTSNIKLRQHLTNDWHVVLPADVTKEQAQDETYVAKVMMIGSQNFGAFDEILAVGEGAEWACEYLVVDAGLSWLSVKLTATHEFPMRHAISETRLPSGYSLMRDPIHRWFGATRDEDGLQMVSHCTTREEAIAELVNLAIFR